MLPEQVIRELMEECILAPLVGVVNSTRYFLAEMAHLEHVRCTGHSVINYMPQTLTGDDWRAAWANAHDAETQKALDVIYK